MALQGTAVNWNKPEIAELFNLPPDVDNRIIYEADQKQINAGTFTVWLEDHTLGNAVRMQLLRDEFVTFGGYKVPHPVIPKIEFRVQTSSDSSPHVALIKAAKELASKTERVEYAFDRALLQWEAAHI
jgi:DNA-directed RNA polymerase II subunit RPB11